MHGTTYKSREVSPFGTATEMARKEVSEDSVSSHVKRQSRMVSDLEMRLTAAEDNLGGQTPKNALSGAVPTPTCLRTETMNLTSNLEAIHVRLNQLLEQVGI